MDPAAAPECRPWDLKVNTELTTLNNGSTMHVYHTHKAMSNMYTVYMHTDDRIPAEEPWEPPAAAA